MKITLTSKFNKDQIVYQNDVFGQELKIIATNFSKGTIRYLCEFDDGVRLWLPEDELTDEEVITNI